ncbi:MAG: signal peptidase II [Candidatus Polarisedimenticolia bacterium]
MNVRSMTVAVAVSVVALDRVTKAMVEAWLDAYRSVTLVPGLLDLTYVQNPGGVFGVFKGLEPVWRSVLFTVVPVAAIVLIAVYAWRVPATQTMTHVALALILGGAVGNLVDRVRLGYVVDFVDVHWRGWHWPAFNVADSAICVGVGLLLLESLRSPAPAAAAPARRDAP